MCIVIEIKTDYFILHNQPKKTKDRDRQYPIHFNQIFAPEKNCNSHATKILFSNIIFKKIKFIKMN